MTTFTRIAEGETPTISVDVSRRLSKIGRYLAQNRERPRTLLTIFLDPNIYGGFTE
jgi:hypothetical protein